VHRPDSPLALLAWILGRCSFKLTSPVSVRFTPFSELPNEVSESTERRVSTSHHRRHRLVPPQPRRGRW